jgi:murein DD-endopeptidase MepM/ murein hydrolase activator NlpD
MKANYKILAFAVFVGLSVGLFWFENFSKNNVAVAPTTNQAGQVNVSLPVVNQNAISGQNTNDFQPPLDRAGERVTKKPFGIFITPQNSPVQPEKFSGYHTGTDFEIFPAELNATVAVRAVCAGKLAVKKYATGYGGVAVESCNLNGQPMTVVYGHLRLASIILSAGANLKVGDIIGALGNAYSSETSGERKHLHLGFHKGTNVNILGYVQSKNELSSWLDPCLSVCYD